MNLCIFCTRLSPFYFNELITIMNVAKSILALSLYLARKADMELEQVTEDSLKEEQKQKAKSPKKDKTEEHKRKISEAYKGTKGKHWKLVDGKKVYY